ncbi:hypothetical protein B0J14DRAFT_183853 [Halenospora varia]|nr:hypothetical protein B0J14DRAFT_183853 [Halenospora varia]
MIWIKISDCAVTQFLTAGSASAGSLWVSLFEIFEPHLGSHAGVVVAAYCGDSSDIESLEGSAKEAFLFEIKSRCQDILRALYAAIPTFKEFLKVIAPRENKDAFAAPSTPSSGSYIAILEPDENWPDDATSKSGSSHTSISEDPGTQIELLRVDLEAEMVMMDARWKIVNGEYIAPWWMKGVPVEKISEEDPYWDKQWTKSRDAGMPNSTSYFDSKECPVHLNQIVSKECIADGGKTNGLLNINYISSLKSIISILVSWGFTDVEAFQWFRLRLGLQLEEHRKLHPDKSLGLRWKICQFSKTDRKYLKIKQEVEATYRSPS